MLHPYHLQTNSEYAYEFITHQEIKYVIYFLDYSYMFSDYPHIADNIFTFNIEVIEGNENDVIADEQIGITIVEVLKLFFEKLQNVAVYVCDNLDSRHLARKRKFDLWFWKYNDGTILKEDGIAVIEDVEILNSMLIHKSNPNITEIIMAYKLINERANK